MVLSFLLCTSVNSVMIIFKDKAKPSVRTGRKAMDLAVRSMGFKDTTGVPR